MDQTVQQYWENEKTQSMSDPRIAELEAKALGAYIEPDDVVLDVGCGSGDGTKYVMEKCKEYVGFERSKTMIKKFKEACFSAEQWNWEIIEGDMKEIPEELNGKFSKVICQRSLINLESRDEQLAVLKRLPQLLKDGGRIILCEAFEDGLAELNRIRGKFELDPMEPRWHNLYLTDDLIWQAFPDKNWRMISWYNFGAYYFLTRVMRAAIEYPNIPTKDSKFNEVAQQIQQQNLFPCLIQAIGPVKIQVWCRKH